MKNILCYDPYSNTIRQLPQNFLIARQEDYRWIVEPDLAADSKLVVKVTLALLKFENKYQREPLKLLAEIT